MIPNPTKEIIDLRWNNAKLITNKIKQFCKENSYGFQVDNSFETDNIIYTEDCLRIEGNEINLYMSLNKSGCTNLYTNDVTMDHGVHNTTEDWYKNCSIGNLHFIKLIKSSLDINIKIDKIQEVQYELG